MADNDGAAWSGAEVDRLVKLYFSASKLSIDAMVVGPGRTRYAI